MSRIAMTRALWGKLLCNRDGLGRRGSRGSDWMEVDEGICTEKSHRGSGWLAGWLVN